MNKLCNWKGWIVDRLRSLKGTYPYYTCLFDKRQGWLEKWKDFNSKGEKPINFSTYKPLNYLTFALICTLSLTLTTSLQAQNFGQNWFHPDKIHTHICDETCVPALTEQEWEEQQQKMREMEERASTRADSVYTDERYPPEDLLPEGTIMNAYIIYNTELYNLLENGADDSLQLQAELE